MTDVAHDVFNPKVKVFLNALDLYESSDFLKLPDLAESDVLLRVSQQLLYYRFSISNVLILIYLNKFYNQQMFLQSVSDWHMFHVYQFHSLIDFVINIVTAYLPLTHSIYSIHTVLLAILLLNLEQTT